MPKNTDETPSSPFAGLPALASRSLLPILQSVLAEVRLAGVAQGRAEARAEFIEMSHDRAVDRATELARADERRRIAEAQAVANAADDAKTKAHREADAPRKRDRWHVAKPDASVSAIEQSIDPVSVLHELLARLGVPLTQGASGKLHDLTDRDLQTALRWTEACLDRWIALPYPKCLEGVVPRDWKLPDRSARVHAEQRADVVDLGEVPASAG